MLGLGYVLYNVTTDSFASTGTLIEVIDRNLFFWQAGYSFHGRLHEYFFNISTNWNHYTYSELMSIYDSLNQLYVETNGYINKLDSLVEASASIRDNGTIARHWIKIVDDLRSDLIDITEFMKHIEPRIDAYRFFSDLYL